MENHEEGCEVKAQALMTEFGAKFKYIGFSRHVVQEGEAKGKASNVSYCARQIPTHVAELNINL